MSNWNASPPAGETPKLLLGVGLGVILVTGVLLLVGGGFLVGSGRLNWPGADHTVPAELTSTLLIAVNPAATPTPETIPTDTIAATRQPAQNAGNDSLASSSNSNKTPQINNLVFAGQVDKDSEPIAPATTFKAGITEIHAVFDYNNMTPGQPWERVWYLNDDQLLRSVESWEGDNTGRFDYFLDAGGDPLPSGDWRLELLVQGKSLASGTFAIEAAALATVTPTRKVTPTRRATSTRTSPPTPTPTPTATAPRAVSSGGNSGGSGRVYQLAYTKWDGRFHNIYIGDTNGSTERLIIKRAAGPSWSPDGKQLFFFGESGVDQQFAFDGRLDCNFGTISDGIVALDVPATSGDICQVYYGQWLCERKQIDVQSPPSDVCIQSGIRVFQNLDWKEGSARWANVAPDGRAVAFEAKPGDQNRIYFRSIYDTSQFRFELLGEQADWSPDGQRLVYRSGRDNKQGLWISSRDDTGHTLITNEGTDSFPAWSPDGRTIVFTRDSGGGNLDLYAVNVDGSNARRLTDALGHDILATFTPGGDIVFLSDRNGSWSIWKMAISGSGQYEIITNTGVGPDWAMSRMDAR